MDALPQNSLGYILFFYKSLKMTAIKLCILLCHYLCQYVMPGSFSSEVAYWVDLFSNIAISG